MVACVSDTESCRIYRPPTRHHTSFKTVGMSEEDENVERARTRNTMNSSNELNEIIIADIVKLIEQHPRVSFRQLAVLTEFDPQHIYWSLKELCNRKLIESVKISNTKSGWAAATLVCIDETPGSECNK